MRLTILGGGGFRVPLVHRALLADRRRTGITELVLHDVDKNRLDAIARVLAAQARDVPDAPGLLTTTDLDTAVTGSDFVFCAIRVGGLRGRVTDERVAITAGVLGRRRSARAASPTGSARSPWPAASPNGSPTWHRRPGRSTSPTRRVWSPRRWPPTSVTG